MALEFAQVDRAFLPQELLDLSTRERFSRLPWKGQFTPEFVDVLLDAYLPNGGSVLDPFAGSGTVLFEASRRGSVAHGAEVNDAALAFSRVAELGSLNHELRGELLCEARHLLGRWPRQPGAESSLWDDSGSVSSILEAARDDSNLWRIVSATVVLAQITRSQLVRSSLLEALARIGEIVLESTAPAGMCCVYRADARSLPLAEATIDLAVTSPPYINVHNYHQYARVAVEFLGGKPLDAARSEIGANRKFRQNRFLTVVQYAIDMAEVLAEMRRVVQPAGRVIFVIGRESRVRGITFENGRLLAELVRRERSFSVRRRMERSFINRFGARIFEDIVELAPTLRESSVQAGRSVGTDFLRAALRGSVDGRQRRDLDLALEQAEFIAASPKLAAANGHAQAA